MRRGLILGLLGAVLAGCGGSTHSARDAGSHPRSHRVLDAGARDAGMAATEPDAAATTTASADSGTDSGSFERPKPTNVSFETAQLVPPDSHPILQDVLSATQVDYFEFDGKAGEFYAMSTEVGNFSPDNIMSFYDSDRTLLAQNDVGSIWPNDLVDTRLVVRLPHDGTYYVSLHDPGIPPDFFSNNSFPLLFYHFTLNSLEGDVAGYARAQADTAPDLSFLMDKTTGYSYVTLIGLLAPGASDRFAFSSMPAQILVGQVLKDGLTDDGTIIGSDPQDALSGNGSTARFGAARVRDTSTNHTLAAIDSSRGQDKLHPPLDEGHYELSLSTPSDATLGDNSFYAVNVVLLPDNPREQDETGNDTENGAETIQMEGALDKRGLLLASLPEHDIDYFRFQANAGDYSRLICEAESGGSGVRGLHAEIRDMNDAMLAQADEASDKNAFIDAFQLGAAGSYYVRLSSTGVASDGTDTTEAWVRCSIEVGP